ncbi:periplasmic alpha-carbonic anhydrase [Ilyonectria robusta]|uniref:periplasmic alpha-carbonic anhydrase n=1 Tax=Ilyonectria robusta TaxID=1079257 RepID=UPI001E8D5F75|nr:periplasmic alpha-carbonic anhydrase [Ilyonectria robusta]KAH8670707.1 periplasmic alpha-carbonic anhydrase [Ilyonectria robusta]
MAGSIHLKLALVAALASKALASCAYGTLLRPRAEEGATVEIKDFAYIGTKGPTNWVALNAEENALCASGKNQSPIDMVADAFTIIPAAEIGLAIPDMAEGTEFENLGTTVEVVAGQGNMTFGGVSYTLAQFHFHLPSEHLDNGTSMAMEMHMVWEGAAGEIAVIGTFIDIADGAAAAEGGETATAAPNATARQLPAIEGSFFHVNAPAAKAMTASTLLETVFSSVEEIAEPGTVTKTQPLIMSELVNALAAGSFQTYDGSLTTPPCSEGVRWLVSDQKLSIQTATFVKARSVIGFNSRFPQGTLGETNVLEL